MFSTNTEKEMINDFIQLLYFLKNSIFQKYNTIFFPFSNPFFISFAREEFIFYGLIKSNRHFSNCFLKKQKSL
ncbi:hypothetical protein B0A78_02850 [Flavobacterium columnare NBRC 100251 = ATCC 23463]|nr:hypothetical protein Pf1_01187 [Flavobacterium columnare]PDS26220.1 hypothetical protein B0A78_02850 [Flavobacterium columnare NBRC 100251 = ATCC 23463]APT22604.1 hypothetical protein BU993_08190 [Flavobacterium columnare]MBF6651921.1 hypothetical protein [Flavobacterium columnare]MBF6655422.1 hypothetical protein [Flavobacterium columnare]